MMRIRFAHRFGWLLMFWSVAAFAEVVPYPPYPGAVPSESYKVTVNGQPVFVHRFLTFDQFNWMDYASFAMTGKVHVEITHLISERKVITCHVRPLAYGIHLIMGKNVASILFRNVTMDGAVVRNAEQLKPAGSDLSVPVKFEP